MFTIVHIFFREGDNGEAWYYSCPAQFELLLEALDSSNYESALCQEMLDFKDEIIRQMSITEKITNQAKGNRKSYLEVETGLLLFRVLIHTKYV